MGLLEVKWISRGKKEKGAQKKKGVGIEENGSHGWCLGVVEKSERLCLDGEAEDVTLEVYQEPGLFT